MLSDKGRLTLSMAVQAWVERALALPGINLVAIESTIAVDAGILPGTIHGDPADRFLIATARALACPIMTVDRAILDYARQGHVKAIDARR
jgi:PIN domain nuclease of toxin-antitoxin system